MSKSTTSSTRRLRRIGFASGATTTLVLALTATPAFAAVDVGVVSPLVGPTGGGNIITFTTPAGAANSLSAAPVHVRFQLDPPGGSETCTAQNTAAAVTPIAHSGGTVNAGVVDIAGGNVRVFSANKLMITVPAGIAFPGGTTVRQAEFMVCVYDAAADDANSANLLARTPVNASYRIADVPTLDPATITASNGPAQGGDSITITGTNLAGGQVLIDNQLVTRTNSTSDNTTYTGTVPAHAAGGPFTVSAVSQGNLKATYAGVYTYSNGIKITPNTAPNTRTAATDIDILGVGFAAMDFSTSSGGGLPNSAGAHVYLVRGVYDPTATGTQGYINAPKTNGQVAECQDVIPIADTEIICSLYTAGNGVKQLKGNANRSVTNVSVPTTGTTITIADTSNGNIFTQNDVGAAVTGVGNSATGNGAHITAVTSASTATVNKAIAPTSTYSGTVTLLPTRSQGSAARTAGNTTVTATGITSADAGRVVSGPGIPSGATIATAGANTMTLSSAPTTTVTGAITIGPPVTYTPIPNGTYTLTVVNNGNSDVQPGGARASNTYSQSNISSGSTFTVADY